VRSFKPFYFCCTTHRQRAADPSWLFLPPTAGYVFHIRASLGSRSPRFSAFANKATFLCWSRVKIIMSFPRPFSAHFTVLNLEFFTPHVHIQIPSGQLSGFEGYARVPSRSTYFFFFGRRLAGTPVLALCVRARSVLVPPVPPPKWSSTAALLIFSRIRHLIPYESAVFATGWVVRNTCETASWNTPTFLKFPHPQFRRSIRAIFSEACAGTWFFFSNSNRCPYGSLTYGTLGTFFTFPMILRLPIFTFWSRLEM